MTTTSQRWLIIFAMAMVMVVPVVRAQSAIHWTAYKMTDGLAEPVFDSISTTPQGELIATHVNAPMASELDGYSASNFPAPAKIAGRICESPGGQRWALVSNGLAEFKNSSWLPHSVPEISAAFHTPNPHQGTLPAILPVRQGSVLFLLSHGLMEFLADDPETPRTLQIKPSNQTSIGDFNSLAVSHDEALWISGAHGLARIAGPVRNLDPKTAWQEYPPPDTLQLCNFGQLVPSKDGGIIAVAESSVDHQKTVVIFDGHNWSSLPAGSRKIFYAWREPDQTLWAVTTNSLFEWNINRTNWVEHEEISPGRISDVAVEPNGAFWLATSEGLFRGSLPLWSRPEAVHELDSPVACMASDGDGWLYFISGNKLHRLRNEIHGEYSLPPACQGTRGGQSLFPLKDGSLLVDAGNTLFQFKPSESSFVSVNVQDQNRPVVTLGLLPDGNICLSHAGEHPALDEFDGLQFRPLPNPPSFSGNEDTPSTLFTSRGGDIWIGAARSVSWCHDGKWQQFGSEDHSAPEAAVGFAEMTNGIIWCATQDEIWSFDGKKWSLSNSRFNHINALVEAHDGTVWLASNGGLFHFCNGIWMENGEPEGLPTSAVTALCKDQHGQIWAGNAHGVNVFHFEADTNPPRTFVRWLGGNVQRLAEGDVLNLLFDGADRWRITPRERLLYSYQIDQHGWSAFQDATMVSLPAAAAGRHSFQVRAMNRNGNMDPVSATLDFAVITPWFREARLWIILLMGVAVAIFFAAVAWNRHRQLIRSYAAVEQKVAERTRELEIATRELLHSQKMNALGTLAAGIAHDFNNILSIIKGSAQIIEDNPGQPEKIRTRVNRIKTVVQQGAEIVDAMLGFGRGSDAAALPCDVNAVVADTIKLLGDRFLREVEVKFERAENLPVTSTTRGFIQQILLNFIFNAAEAMSSRKKITLATRLTNRLPPDIFLPPATAVSFVLISVRDQGGGILPEIKARIFEPFFTTKALSTKRGTGLGLSMVYELAKKMGAGLAVQSVTGQGSTFTLILPVQEEPAAKKQAEVPAEPLHL